jgi:hypothetical protein
LRAAAPLVPLPGPRGLWWGATLGLAIVALLQVARIVFRFRGDIARVG